MFEDEPREEGEGFYVRRRNKRSVSLLKHIEILLVADYSMTKYYSSRDLESYLFTIMNMVSQVSLIFFENVFVTILLRMCFNWLKRCFRARAWYQLDD